MSDLFKTLYRRADANARHAVDVYTRELPDYRDVRSKARGSAAMLEFALTLRRRCATLAAEDLPFAEEDLAYLAAVGAARAEAGVSLAAQRQVLLLHTRLTLNELHEAAGPNDLGDVMRVLGWLARNGVTAQDAYTRGYLEGQKALLPFVARVQLLARLLLSDDAAAAELARDLDIPLQNRYLVTIARLPDAHPRPRRGRRDEIVKTLLENHRMPLTWHTPDELTALVPCDAVGPADEPAAARARALSLVRDFAGLTGASCSLGVAEGRPPALAEAASLARRISRAAPIQRVPRLLHGVADVFVELGSAQVPQVDDWLREVARRLSSGPDLVTTLDAYYRNDMNRMRTAMELHVHPRTLDYRLRRVRDLVGLDPASTRGVRVLSTVVTRILAGAWPEPSS